MAACACTARRVVKIRVVAYFEDSRACAHAYLCVCVFVSLSLSLCGWECLFACTIFRGRYAPVAAHPTSSRRHPKPAPTSVVPKPLPTGGGFALRPLNEQAGPLNEQGGVMQRMTAGWTWPWKVVPSVSTSLSTSVSTSLSTSVPVSLSELINNNFLCK